MKTALILSIAFVVTLAGLAVLLGLVYLLVRLRDLEAVAKQREWEQNRNRYD